MAANLEVARVTVTATDWPLDGVALRALAAPYDEVRPLPSADAPISSWIDPAPAARTRLASSRLTRRGHSGPP
jgi:hypothetical protein